MRNNRPSRDRRSCAHGNSSRKSTDTVRIWNAINRFSITLYNKQVATAGQNRELSQSDTKDSQLTTLTARVKHSNHATRALSLITRTAIQSLLNTAPKCQNAAMARSTFSAVSWFCLNSKEQCSNLNHLKQIQWTKKAQTMAIVNAHCASVTSNLQWTLPTVGASGRPTTGISSQPVFSITHAPLPARISACWTRAHLISAAVPGTPKWDHTAQRAIRARRTRKSCLLIISSLCSFHVQSYFLASM